MPIFGRKAIPKPDVQAAGDQLGAIFEAYSTDGYGRIRVEDLLSAAAAVCGEACIAAAGEFDPDEHTLTPGAAVFSDRVNDILLANAGDWGAAGTSVFGIIRSGALAGGYAAVDFPAIDEPIRQFAATVGSGDPQATWGRVALSVPDANWPRSQPLRQAFELRPAVRAIFTDLRIPRNEWPSGCAAAVVVELARVRQAIDPGIALRIVLETVNGMSKMAPMTIRHMREAAT